MPYVSLALDEQRHHLRRRPGCRDSQGREHARVEITVLASFDIAADKVDVVGSNRQQQRLCFPAHLRAVATHPHRLEV